MALVKKHFPTLTEPQKTLRLSLDRVYEGKYEVVKGIHFLDPVDSLDLDPAPRQVLVLSTGSRPQQANQSKSNQKPTHRLLTPIEDSMQTVIQTFVNIELLC